MFNRKEKVVKKWRNAGLPPKLQISNDKQLEVARLFHELALKTLKEDMANAGILEGSSEHSELSGFASRIESQYRLIESEYRNR